MPLISHTPETVLCTPRGTCVEIACDHCGKHFSKRAKYVRADLARGRCRYFCSTECRSKGSRVLKDVTECEECHVALDRTKDRRSQHSFCSKRCAALYTNRQRSIDSYKKQTRFYLRTYMEFEESVGITPTRVVQAAVVLNVKCEGCGKDLKRTTSDLKKMKHGKPYCSKSCRMTHYNAHILPRISYRRSELENMLTTLIRVDFPDLKIMPNDRSTLDGHLEIDIYLPTIPLAIELNGPVHYLPIYGDERLKKVQTKDSRKHLELHERGIALLVLDISKLNSKKQQRLFVEKQYLELIRPLIMEAREGVSPTIA